MGWDLKHFMKCTGSDPIPAIAVPLKLFGAVEVLNLLTHCSQASIAATILFLISWAAFRRASSSLGTRAALMVTERRVSF
jgi:hypothetical protein